MSDLQLVHFYYSIKPMIPRRLQLALRRCIVLRKKYSCCDTWPIDESAAVCPADWSGWPENRKFALVLTHDVDTAKGQSRCRDLMELEKSLGFRSSFNFVPKRYPVSASLRLHMEKKGFEIGVHGLYHDGKYFRSKEIFTQRAALINGFLNEWHSVGFRSPSMLHRLDWMHELQIEYDASTFDTDPFEPQPQGIRSIFPVWIPGVNGSRGFVELPYTLPQDFTLFVIMREKTIDIWEKKLDWIAEKGGMVLLNAHPDYIRFDGEKPGEEEYPAEYYAELLNLINTRYRNRFWHVLPREMARYWANHYQPAPVPLRSAVIQPV